jgi:hypothetical protein
MINDFVVSEALPRAAWTALIAAAVLSGCSKSEAAPSDVPVLSEPYEYSVDTDEFTGTTVEKAQRTDLKAGLVLTTTFGCVTGSNGGQARNLKSTYFVFSLQTMQGAPIVPTRIRFKVDDQPPFEAVWRKDANPNPETFIVPYSQILVGGVNQDDRYSAAWATGMTPYLENPFQFDLVEPAGKLDFNLIGLRGTGALVREAATAKQLMIRYTLADGTEQDVDMNLDDPAIRHLLSKCGWNLEATGGNSTAVSKQQRITWDELRTYNRDINFFTNTSRWCHEDGKRDSCSDARHLLADLAAKGICPVGEPGRQVWGRCLAKDASLHGRD